MHALLRSWYMQYHFDPEVIASKLLYQQDAKKIPQLPFPASTTMTDSF
jgi:hypothetical protein